MSPYSNVGRTDRFADPVTFATEMIRRTRDVVGPEMALLIRIPADEYRGEEGITLEMVVDTIAPALERAGIDGIDITTGNWHRFDAIIPSLYYSRATLVPYAEEVKKAVKVPVIGVGRINDHRLVENLIEEGRVDLVGLGRQLYADPELPNKMLTGRQAEIRKCLGCDACQSPRLPRSGIICAINPTLMRAGDFPLTRATRAKKVLVIGGGVAGMEAARVASQRGHEIILAEKTGQLGGQVNVSAAIPRLNTRDLHNYARQLEGWIRKLGVRIELNKEITSDSISEIKPDTVLLATGSRSLIPAIVGADRPMVLREEDAVLDQSRVGQRVAILGAARGAEIAVSLANSGRQVTILEQGHSSTLTCAPYLFGHRRLALARTIKHSSIQLLTEVRVQEITSGGVTYVDSDGIEQSIEVDSVIVTLGRTPNKELEKIAREMVDEVIVIGDASRPMSQLNAIHDGFFAAYGIGDPKGLEVSRLAQIARWAGEQTRIPAPGSNMELEWGTATSLPPLHPGREVRLGRRRESEPQIRPIIGLR